jgi:diguanylate cyclase (GGDEF)-like protein
VLAATIVNVILVMIALSLLFRLLKRHRTTADELRTSRDQLSAGLLELKQRNAEMALLAQMARILDSSMSLNEALESITVYCRKLLPKTSGELFLYRNSRNVLEKAVQWGEPRTPCDAIEPHECWGLRLGQVHRVSNADDLFCFHHNKQADRFREHLCIPLTAQGEVLGLICIEAGSPECDAVRIDQSDQDLVIVMAEQLSLALSNVKLKEMLKQQSIVDPLTCLFNRRYMDETLQRELARAKRKSVPLALVMIDVDHFKSINDRFGHDAGDEVLRTIALRIRENVREGDLVCRFGGEEIVIVMPECGAADAYLRADRIRQAVRSIEIRHGDHRIGPVTASFGIASYPQDATDPGALTEAADSAMYEAKRLGRDLVMMAGQQAVAIA